MSLPAMNENITFPNFKTLRVRGQMVDGRSQYVLCPTFTHHALSCERVSAVKLEQYTINYGIIDFNKEIKTWQ